MIFASVKVPPEPGHSQIDANPQSDSASGNADGSAEALSETWSLGPFRQAIDISDRAILAAWLS